MRLRLRLHIDAELLLWVSARMRPGAPGYCVDDVRIELTPEAAAKIEAEYAEEITQALVEAQERTRYA